MKHKWKRVLAYLLVFAMVLGMMPDVSIVSYAQEAEMTTEATVSETNTESKTETMDEEVMTSEEVTTEAATESTTEFITTECITTESTEIATTVEATTEIVNETTTECMTENRTEESVTTEVETKTESTTEQESIVSGNTDTSTESITPKLEAPIIKMDDTLDVQKATSGDEYVIYSDGEWSGGVVWYVLNNSDNKHYVFCLEKGKTMYSGKYAGTLQKGLSGKDAFRIGTALNYFKYVNGGWASKSKYGEVQQIIWDEGDSSLLTYINHAWKLVEANGNRATSSASYDSRLLAVKESDISSANGIASVAAQTPAQNPKDADGDKIIDAQYGLQGTAWKYFANGGMDSTGIEVVGLYDVNGQPVANEFASETYVDTDGMLHVKYRLNAETGFGYESNPATVLMKVDMPYVGGENIEYIMTEEGIQNLSYSANATSSAYFTMKLYTTNEPDSIYPKVYVNKVDEFGKPVYGCTFRLTGTVKDSAGNDTTFQKDLVVRSVEDGFEIEQVGDYRIEEVAVPNSEFELSHDTWGFEVVEVLDTTTSTVRLAVNGLNITYNDNVVDNGNYTYTYTAKNYYKDGDAKIVKYGNVLTGYKNGQFTYEKRKLPGVDFAFYTAEDIYLGDTLVFATGTQMTNGLHWGTEYTDILGTSQWTHTVRLSSSTTDANGEILIQNLPAGRYYAIETKTPTGFTEEAKKYYFDVTPGSVTEINGSGGIVNEQKPAVCHVFKVDEDSKEPLSGGEFTLYANVANKNYDGQAIFSSSQTVPVVTKRDLINGQDTIVEDTWVPIKTVSTDARGMAEFRDIPAGKYLVVETKAPEGYNLAENSYTFEHSYSNKQTTSGYNFEHTFTDVKKRVYEIKKNAEKAVVNEVQGKVNVDAYIYEETPIAGVKFGIYAAEDIYNTLGTKVAEKGAEVGTCITNEKGIAAYSDILFAGNYYFKELQTADDKKYILDETEYPFTVSSESDEELNKEPIINKQYKGSIKVIKTDGVTKVALSGVEFHLLDADKKVVGTYVTDEKGEIHIKNLPIGTYYIKESKAKENYILDDTLHEVTISKDKLDHEVSLTNQEYKGSIKVIKTDGKTKYPMSDVEFTLYDANNTEIGKYITDENGEILIDNLSMGTYYLQETKTQKGYKLSDEMIEVVITPSDLHKVVAVENNRIDTDITIRTNTIFSGGGGVRTGDASPIGFIMMLFFMSIFGAAYCAKQNNWKVSVGAKKFMFIAWLSVGTIFLGGLTVKAAAELKELSSKELADVEYNGTVYKYALQKEYETSNPEEEVAFDEEVDGMKLADVKYETVETILQKKTLEETKDYKDLIVKDESEVAKTITLDSNVYELQDITWSETPNMENVNYTIDYGYQTAEPKPDATYEYTYTSPVTKKENTVSLPFVRLEKGNEDWVDGFTATVTFHNVDGLYFTLGGNEFEYNPDKLSLSDSDFKELVKMLGYDTSKYRLNSIAWSGKEYKKNGKLCRDAKASGQQYAASYKAYYEDEVENGKIYTAHATYACEVEVPAEEAAPTYVMQATAYYEEEAGVWTNIITFITEHKVASVGLFGVILFFIILVIVWFVSKNKRTASTNNETYTE